MFEYIHSVFNIISVMLIKETLDKFYQTINTGFKVIKGEKSDFDTLITITQRVHNYYNLQQ